MPIGHERTIFLDALEITSHDERAEFVQQACAGAPELVAEVIELLREHERDDNVIDRPLVAGMIPTISRLEPHSSRLGHKTGTMVGPYKLMEQVGEGGFGLVYVAEQQHPVRRRVALKIIKPGMESREVIARFEAERQALAMMDHENIARVFDAGMTDDGQPYFVMELVRGVRLNEFCDNHRLDTQARLQLFVSICNAVQHAHQKGVIHRDLKPSNVLVTLQDGRPVAKVIDFGIVKAIGQSLTDKTIYTRLASMIGTPAYMSPEQAEMSNVDVDTRSDIYSLGVMLYELLTGSTPFTRDRLNSVGFDELRRIIREEEPPRPSARFSTLGNPLSTTVSTNRRLEPAKLVSLMQGDLDWIVMKALDKDRSRRYPSAIAMAEDISRFLKGQPVEARPPSTAYRFSKFARRNKVMLFTLSIIATTLVVGTAVSVWQTRLAWSALQKARAAGAEATQSRDELERFTDRLKRANRLLMSGRAHAEADDWASAYAAYTDATEIQPRYFHVWMERGAMLAKVGLWEEAAADYAKAVELGVPVDGAEFHGIPQLLLWTGDVAGQRQLAQERSQSGDKRSWGAILRGQLVGELSPAAIERLIDLGERLLLEEADPTTGREPLQSWMPLGAKFYIAGWANLRGGNLSLAIERLQQAYDDAPDWRGRGISFPLLAMAYHETGQATAAMETLQKSQEALDGWFHESVENHQGMPPIPWFDWVEFLINHRQATLLIRGEIMPADPRLEHQRALAEAAIR
ncbi:serine/threonine protein kinase [Allorhodopirellula solitaria]|uniref:Serine/threonine-protein kinase PknB n=1 Tax=Allorhodopirellula solitaria TaxID=2527987 RepID=A0A5C5YE38_9BACT|nr:serine/threonine-protein kinase [Allorhodopirellula solitaria]TWT74017.1 Serine/threonine-protein kinase PknB [Allorhodopirellula solitaria]